MDPLLPSLLHSLSLSLSLLHDLFLKPEPRHLQTIRKLNDSYTQVYTHKFSYVHCAAKYVRHR